MRYQPNRGDEEATRKLVCWRCGAVMEEGAVKCAECGANRPATRRKQAASEAAEKLHQPVKAQAQSEAARQLQQQRAKLQQASAKRAAPRDAKGGRSASQRPSAGIKQQGGSRGAPSMARASRDGKIGQAAAATAGGKPRMIKRHQYEAILPETQGYDQVNWLRLCMIAFACVVLLVGGIYFFLRGTSPGQKLLAAYGREASRDAYHELGRTYLSEGQLSKAVWALEIAQTKDEDNGVELLNDLGRAYLANTDVASAELAYSRAITYWPSHPEAYRMLVDIYLDQERNYEATKLLEQAMDQEDPDASFETMLKSLLPAVPTSDKSPDTKYTTEQIVKLTTTTPGAKIYYTLDAEDPVLTGEAYNPLNGIFLTEGSWRLRAVAEKDGMYSEELLQIYTINKPTPDMPKASLQPGEYTYPKSITLRYGQDVVAVYYTVDGTDPTVNSKEYKDEPIALGIGYTTVKAVAINGDEKTSPIFSVTYKVNGQAKQSFGESDTVAGLKLFSTTQSEFEGKYGQPQEVLDDGKNILGTYTKLVYDFGHACFVDRGNEREPVLAELVTRSSAFAGPRDTGIGSTMDDVIAAFRDLHGEANVNGERILYTLEGNKQGRMDRTRVMVENEEGEMVEEFSGEKDYHISYYTKLENGMFIELTYVVEDGMVVQMEWYQFDT